MKKGLFIFAIIFFVAVFAFMVVGSSSAADKKVYRWKIQSAFPHGDLSMDQLSYFAKAARERSEGRLIISVFADPEIVAGPTMLFEATKKGTIQILHMAPIPISGIVPVGAVEFGMPYQYIIPEETTSEGKAHAIRKFFFDGIIDTGFY